MKHEQVITIDNQTRRRILKSPYAEITENIISAIENGSHENRMPWHKVGNPIPSNVETGKLYRGINILSLWSSSVAKSFDNGIWGTYKQWTEQGCQVKKGERSSPIVFWDSYEDDQTERENPRILSYCKRYSVFNSSQVDGFVAKHRCEINDNERIANAEVFFLNLQSDIRPGGNVAGYSKSADFIRIPELSQFDRSEGYYSVLSHEHIHWSGHKLRLDRDLSGRFGDSAYAMEELIAELGAAFLCAELQVQTCPREDHAGYIASWLRVLKNDSKAIFTAASAAQKAVDYLVEVSQDDPVLIGKALYMETKRVFNLSS